MINHISINDLFWGYIQKYLISFGNDDLPKNIHYTVSFNDNSPDINFHVTKNTISRNKPHIGIVCIDKKLLNEVIPFLFLSLFKKIFTPLNIADLVCNNTKELGFISFDNLKKDEISLLISQEFIENFKDIYKIRKKSHLKIKGKIKKRLNNIFKCNELKDRILNNLTNIPIESQKSIESGLIVSKNSFVFAILINKNWFVVRENLAPFDILTSFIKSPLARHLIWKTKKAIESLRNVETYDEVKHLNKPIRLVFIREDQMTQNKQR